MNVLIHNDISSTTTHTKLQYVYQVKATMLELLNHWILNEIWVLWSVSCILLEIKTGYLSRPHRLTMATVLYMELMLFIYFLVYIFFLFILFCVVILFIFCLSFWVWVFGFFFSFYIHLFCFVSTVAVFLDCPFMTVLSVFLHLHKSTELFQSNVVAGSKIEFFPWFDFSLISLLLLFLFLLFVIH